MGVGTIDTNVSLSLSIVTTMLQKPMPPTIYIVAPHTHQTIPLVHSLLASKLSDSAAAMSLLNNVQLLQYFDFAGLSESIAEISERLYQLSQNSPDIGTKGPRAISDPKSKPPQLVLIQGLVATILATQRRSGFVQANAILSNLTRDITRLSRSSGAPLVLVDIHVGVNDPSEPAQQNTRDLRRETMGIELDSAFSGPNGESFRMDGGSSSLSQILEASFDRLVLVHDGFGRVTTRPKDKKMQRKLVIEAIKDRLGGMTGVWALWEALIG